MMNKIDVEQDTSFIEPDEREKLLSFRELEGLDKQLRTIRGSLKVAIAKRVELDGCLKTIAMIIIFRYSYIFNVQILSTDNLKINCPIWLIAGTWVVFINSVHYII